MTQTPIPGLAHRAGPLPRLMIFVLFFGGAVFTLAGFLWFHLRPPTALAAPAKDPVPPAPRHAFRIDAPEEFTALSLPLSVADRTSLLGRRGPYTRAIVPVGKRAAVFCGQQAACLRQPVFVNTRESLPFLQALYPAAYQSVTPQAWAAMTQGPAVARVYLECFVQDLRQAPGTFGFDCLDNAPYFLSLAEATDAFAQLSAAVSIGAIAFAPDEILDTVAAAEAQSWVNPPMAVFHETVWLPDIQDEARLFWLTGYDLSAIQSANRPLLFIAALPSAEVFCASFLGESIDCLNHAVFGSGALLHHQAYFQLAAPDLAQRFPLRVLEGGGIYQRGVIWRDPSGPYKFNLNNRLRPGELYSRYDIREVYDSLQPHFQAGILYYAPSGAQLAAARQWPDPGFPMFLEDEVVGDYEAYTAATAVGELRIIADTDLERLERSGELNWRIFPVLSGPVPETIAAPIAGIITAERQSPVATHLSVLMARRNAPNAYVRNAANVLAGYDGRLVEVTVGALGYTVREVTLTYAEAWWDANRRQLPPPHPMNRTEARLERFVEMQEHDPTSLVSRFGGKAAGLGAAYQFLPEENQLEGFGVPLKYFLDFMQRNTIPDFTQVELLQQGIVPPRVSLTEYYHRLLQTDLFRSDSVYRKIALEDFQHYLRSNEADVDPALLEQVREKILSLWGQDAYVRFRSSSNLEDGLEFSGAGLYDSTGVCLEDDRQNQPVCGVGGGAPRTIRRGLKTVWSSLFSYRAFEERAYYGLPQTLDRVGMGIAVNTGVRDERSNGVAFTGDPARIQLDQAFSDYLVNVQLGDFSVVAPDPEVTPEVDAIRVEAGGRIGRIIRLRSSSLVGQGETVLSDEEARALGELMVRVDREYPIDAGRYPPNSVLKDLEFKVVRAGTADGTRHAATHQRPIIKQVRPFLLVPTLRFTEFGPPPAPPFDLSADAVAGSAVRLRWQDTADNEDQFVVERQTVGEAGLTEIATLGANAVEYLDETVQPGGTYAYQVKAENAFGVSTPSGLAVVSAPAAAAGFIRGDVDQDGRVNITDAIAIIEYLFTDPQRHLPCLDAADVNDSGRLNISDPIFILNFLFQDAASQIPPPFPAAGPDPTADNLDCAASIPPSEG